MAVVSENTSCCCYGRCRRRRRKILDANLPGAVKGRNGVSIFLGMGQQLHQVVTGDNTGRDNIGAAHGERKVEGITIRESVVEIYFWIWFL